MVVTTRFRYPTANDITISVFVPDFCHECEVKFTRDSLPASVGGFDFWDALAREVDALEVGYREIQQEELVEYRAREKRARRTFDERSRALNVPLHVTQL